MIELIAAGAVGIGTGLATPALMKRLPPPEDDPANLYQPLTSARFAALTATTAALATLAILTHTPAPARPAGVVLATLGVLMGLIDEATMRIPLVVSAWAAVLMAPALACGVLAGGTWVQVVTAFCCWAGTGLLYLALWRWAGVGFGDVRLAGLVGAATGMVSPDCAMRAIALAVILTPIIGVTVHHARHRTDLVPAGGCLTAAALTALITG